MSHAKSAKAIIWKGEKMNNLQLSLKRQWFEMTKAGIKKEDYREITPYWFVRLFENTKGQSKLILQEYCDSLIDVKSAGRWNFDNGFYFKLKHFTHNTITLGYPKSTDTDRILKFEHKGIEIRTGNPEWGAEEGKLYFVILHGNLIP